MGILHCRYRLLRFGYHHVWARATIISHLHRVVREYRINEVAEDGVTQIVVSVSQTLLVQLKLNTSDRGPSQEP